MSKQLKHMGEFLSRCGVVWRVEILQEASQPFSKVGSLIFEAEEALVIEWKHTDKEEVLCGSTATLQIESPGDRTYEDLYSIEVGQIRMDVYKDGALYWSGALDPEFYEEPYEREAHYVVTLTFSDFGILGRLKYNLSGMQTMHGILIDALQRSTINYGSLDDTTYCTTLFEDGRDANPTTLSVRSENFFDEDGEASTLEDAVIGILQPLALRMIQRCGKVYVYDLNGLHTKGARKRIEWDGDSQTMGVDKVANNVKVNFSPYASGKLIDGSIEYGGEYAAEMVNLTSDRLGYYSYYPDYSDEHRQGYDWDYNLINFTIFLNSKGSGLQYLNPSASYAHILPLVGSATECDCISWGFRTGGHGALTTGWPQLIGNKVGKGEGVSLMKTHRAFIPKLAASDNKIYYVRVQLEMLLDARYNPFSSTNNDGNENGNYDGFKVWTGWAFVPVAINLYDSEGKAIYHYTNKDITESASIGHLGYCKGKWEKGEASFGDAWLAYYDPKDLKESAGILGWKTNRHNIGRPDHDSRKNTTYGTYRGFKIFDSFKEMEDGQYMPYPPDGGYLEIKVYTGVRCFDYGENGTFEETKQWDKKGLYDKVRWLLYKAPVVEVVKNNLVFDSAELDDVEYSGYINKAAKEEINIDTICGTANLTCPTAKGIIHRASDNLQIMKLKRAGVTDHPERLLIGTLYSQFANRKTTLTGIAVIDSGGLTAYTEANQGKKVFMMSEESQDVIADDTEAMYTEFNPDEYEAIEEV